MCLAIIFDQLLVAFVPFVLSCNKIYHFEDVDHVLLLELYVYKEERSIVSYWVQSCNLANVN